MTSDRVVPERTIDSLFAIEWIRSNPYGLIWSPTNSDSAPDHILYAPGLRGYVIECKASLSSESNRDGWYVSIDDAQLETYCSMAEDVMYLFLFEPADPSAPWVTNCTHCGGDCAACPRDSRRLSHLEPIVKTSPIVLRLQPWFAHWAFLLAARDVRTALRLGPARLRPIGLPASAIRLCHFLSELTSGDRQAPLLAEYGLDNFPQLWDRDEESSLSLAISTPQEFLGR